MVLWIKIDDSQMDKLCYVVIYLCIILINYNYQPLMVSGHEDIEGLPCVCTFIHQPSH